MDAAAAASRESMGTGDAWMMHATPAPARAPAIALSPAPLAAESAVARDGGRYELIGELASGGMATVYLARMRGSMGLSRLVAIKAMHPHFAKDEAFTSMFVDEARLTARLRHPNVVPTLDIVAESGQLLLVMEYVEGESLAALSKAAKERGERIPLGIACAVLHDALLGLHEAHEARDDDGAPLAIIHRDVSPQNVMVGVDGLARVLDFGVAKARRTVHFSHDGEIKGKVPYMPPEQLFGEALDRTVDVYAAGVLLWEALAGARLFEGPSEEIIVKRISDGDVQAPSTRADGIPAELDAIVLRALASKPGDRFATALEMAERIGAAVTLPSRTEVATWVRRFARTAVAPISSPALPRERSLETTTDAGAVVAAVRRSHAGGAGADHAGTAENVGSAEPAARGAKQSPRWLVGAFATIALACGALGLVATMQHTGVARAAQNEPAAAAPAERAPETVEAPVVAMPVAPAGRAAAASTTTATATTATTAQGAEVATVERSGATAAVAPSRRSSKTSAHRREDRAPAPAAVSTNADANAASAPSSHDEGADCRPPYVVDGEGHRHYKVECL